MKKYLKLARVHHYIKNILVIAPLFFSGRLSDAALLGKAIFAFFAFSVLSSSVYVLNDLHDAPYDRCHEKKKSRPIASGEIKERSALIFAVCLFFIAVVLAYFAGGGYVYLALYVLINIFYSLKGKNIPILDIALLVSGFLLRVFYGATVTGIEISSWLYLMVMSLSFYLGLGKRRNELKRSSDKAREVLKSYNYNFLDKMMYMFLTMAIIFYSLWATQATGSKMIWTVPLVMLIFMRYALIAEGDSDGDPVDVIVHDKIIVLLTVIYFAALSIILYF
ncbi:MAG: UbiA prenyltransferase family protein [Clostridia bacterium]|nr:UbiA prenyltransferase family protein [Clostridia bacterium]